MGPQILIADDDPFSLELLEETLALERLGVVKATNGEEALRKFAEHTPDLVLLDLQMPHISGLEVCQRIKANPETRLVPVILVTALSHVDDRVRGIDAGADDFLTKPFEHHELLARVRSLLSLKAFTDELERAESVLLSLAESIEGKDPNTRNHCDRLARYASRLGEKLGLSFEMISALRRAGYVHDIGKVAIPDAILLKPERLTPEEMDVMKQHTIVGESICKPLKSFSLVTPIIRHHHEKWNGTGYPDGLHGEQIPLGARILQLVDVFDALVTVRPYKPAHSAAEALAIMESEDAKGWWDPKLFVVFKQLANEEFAPCVLERAAVET